MSVFWQKRLTEARIQSVDLIYVKLMKMMRSLVCLGPAVAIPEPAFARSQGRYDPRRDQFVLGSISIESARGAARAPNVSGIPIVALGWSLSLFLALSFLLCVLLGLVVPDFGLHQPWLQFFPGFTWLTWTSFLLGLIESSAYGWYVALIFGPLYNLLAARAGETLAEGRR